MKHAKVCITRKFKFTLHFIRGLPLITYACKGGGGGGGVSTDAYKCVQGGRGGGGLNMTKNTHFVRMSIENATISEDCST